MHHFGCVEPVLDVRSYLEILFLSFNIQNIDDKLYILHIVWGNSWLN